MNYKKMYVVMAKILNIWPCFTEEKVKTVSHFLLLQHLHVL